MTTNRDVKTTKRITASRLLIATLVVLSAVTALGVTWTKQALAACTAPSPSYGSATVTMSVPSAGTYRAWSRIKPADTTNTTYLLEVDGGTCYNIGGSGLTANSWSWVDFQNDSTKVNLSLTAGTHSFKLIGNKPNLSLDRVILTADLSCVPTAGTTGDNCANPPDTTPPTVALTAPASNALVTGTITMQANAADDAGGSGIAKVEFYVDGVLKAADTTGPSPYTYSFNSTSVADGAHTVSVKSYDAAGNSSPMSTPVSITVKNADTTPPTVAVTGVTAGSTVKGAVTIGATASDNAASGVAKVEFYLDGVLHNTETGAPYCFGGELSGACTGWDSTTVANGTHTVKAVAYDVAGNTANNSVSFTVNNADVTPPTVSIVGITPGTTVSGPVVVSSTANDSGGIAKVEFYLDGTLTQTELNAPYCFTGTVNGVCSSWDSTKATNGTHSIMAKAYDVAGNAASTSVGFTVKNGDTVAPTTPTGVTAKATSATQVTVSWTASTDNVGVTSYCVTRGTVSLGCSVTGTSYTDSTLQPSTSYAYTVTAMDAAGNYSPASTAASVTTPALPDTAAPSIPLNVVATPASPSQINLSWSASTDNVGVTGYDVYRGGVKIATVTSTSYADTALSASTSYSYSVAARDAATNVSAQSATTTATTFAQPVANGALVGTVSSRNGVLPGAQVSLFFNGSTHYYTTNQLGYYSVQNIPAGSYGVTYSYTSNRTVQNYYNVTINSGTTTTKNVTMKVR